MEPQEQSFLVPGLLAAGENDEARRIRSIAVAFSKTEGHQAKWALLFERNSGHDVGKSLNLAKSLFEAVCNGDASLPPVFLDTCGLERRDENSNKDAFCYFPNQQVANIWEGLFRPKSLENLIALPEGPHLSDLVSVETLSSPLECENGRFRRETIQVNSRVAGVTIKGVKVRGPGFHIQKLSDGSLPAEIQICFAPDDLPWGSAKAELTVSGCLNGTDAGTVTSSLPALVKGAVNATPSVVYLGVVPLGQETHQKLLLKTSHREIHVANFKLPEGITAFIGVPDAEGSLPLNLKWCPTQGLGRMVGRIAVMFDAPQKGILQIPVVGFVAPGLDPRPVKTGYSNASCFRPLKASIRKSPTWGAIEAL
jgi:hypothetical protein